MKLLYIDIENTPAVSAHYGQWGINIPYNHTIEQSRMLCYSSKRGDEPTRFYREYNGRQTGMLRALWRDMDWADIIVGWNTQSFDSKHIQRTLFEAGYDRPSPYAHIDLMRVVKREFAFPSNKLDAVSRRLLGDQKDQVRLMDLMLGIRKHPRQPELWALMESYSRQDVDLLPPLWERIRPWAMGHAAVDPDSTGCPRCGGRDI